MTSRLDTVLAARAMARSRTHAAALIADGQVTIDGRPASKAGTRVDDGTLIEVIGHDPYVGRAARKLIAALDGFDIDVAARTALDLGASTGGFTQVLRERGADPVVALDVGHGQLAAQIAADPGVIVVEGFNVRYLTPDRLREVSGISGPADVVTADLSFISLRHVIPAIPGVVGDTSDIVILVKPQFEVGRAGVRGGVVTDTSARADAAMRVLYAAEREGFGVHGVLPSPIAGTHGNVELLVHISRHGGSDPTQWKGTIDRYAGGR